MLPVIYPMNAKTADLDDLDRLLEATNYVAEQKFDGARYLMYITPNGSRFFSRRKSVVTDLPVEKTENLPHLSNYRWDKLVVLDGEIVADGEGSNSNNVVSVMGSLPDRALQLQNEKGFLIYKAFDILYCNGEQVAHKPWHIRRGLLTGFLKELDPNSAHLHATDAIITDKREFYDEIVRRGGEGVILKNIYAPYVYDKRPSDTWYKVKKYNTYDVVIMGYEPATVEYTGKTNLDEWQYWQDSAGNLFNGLRDAQKGHHPIKPVTRYHAHGWVGAVKFGQYNGHTGQLVEIGQTSGFDDATRSYISVNKEGLLGAVMEVGAMEQLKGSYALRHPRFISFRRDKAHTDCILGEQ